MKRLSIPALALLVLTTATAADAARLPRTVIPERYALVITPRIELETFLASEVITVDVREPVREITLHAADLKIDRVWVRGESSRKQRAQVQLDPKDSTLHIRLKREVGPGRAEIRISYEGPLRNDLRGLYQSRTDRDTYLFTQLQPVDARRFFPSFDEPDLKAVFDLSVIVDLEDLAISNTRILSSLPGPARGTRRVRFAPTPPMSTYMLALAIGPFDCLSSRSNDVPVRFCGQRGYEWKGRKTHRASVELLQFYEDWFGLPYPFKKLDVVALPDMAAGGMENPGAIFIRENWAMVGENAPMEMKRWSTSLLAHELAHLWVGDLVTMEWWSDVWLNEGLATWVAADALRELHPEIDLDSMNTFRRIKTFEEDSYESRAAVAAPVKGDEKLFELFDIVTNEKPAAVMSMVERLVGRERMRSAIRDYLIRYSWGSVSTDEFVSFIEKELGEDAAAVIRDFVTRRGFPVVEVASECRDGASRVTFTTGAGEGSPWHVPVCYRLLAPEPHESCVLVSGETTVDVEGACAAPLLVNPGVPDYYRVLYSKSDHEKLIKSTRSLSVLERLSLLDNEWWLVNEGRVSVGEYLDLLERGFSNERNPAVVGAIVTRLAVVERQFVTADARADFIEWARAYFGDQLRRLGVRESKGDSASTKRLRGELVWGAGSIGRDPAVAELAKQYVREYLDNQDAVDESMADAMIHLAARSGDAALYNAYLSKLRHASDGNEAYRFLVGLTSFTSPDLVRRTVELTLTDLVRSQDASIVIGRLLGKPDTADLAWAFIRERWTQLENRLPDTFTSERVVRAAGSFCSAEKRNEVASFFANRDVAPKELRRSLERIDRCVAQRPTQSLALTGWLEESSRMARMRGEPGG